MERALTWLTDLTDFTNLWNPEILKGLELQLDLTLELQLGLDLDLALELQIDLALELQLDLVSTHLQYSAKLRAE